MRNYLLFFAGLLLMSGTAFADELLLSCNEQFEFCGASVQECEEARQTCTEPTGFELLAQTRPQLRLAKATAVTKLHKSKRRSPAMK